MYTFLFITLVLTCLVLIAAILLQAGKGSGLAASFGGSSSAAESVIGTRQAGNLLTRVSWWAGGIFLALSLILSLAGGGARRSSSVLDRTFAQPAAPAGAPAGRPGAAPAVPLTPAAPPAGAPAGAGTPTPAAPAAPAPR